MATWAGETVSIGIRPFVWITAASLVPLLPYFPSGASLALFSGESQTEDARSFLQTLWQVDAAAIALTLAVVLFAFESVRSHARASLAVFAQRTGLTYVLALGIAAIFNIGAVLLGLGAGAPGGWAATWTCVVSAAALGSLPFLLQRSLSAMSAEHLVAQRHQQTREATRAAVEEDIFRRIAMLILVERASREGVEVVGPLFVGADDAYHVVYAEKSGTVSDVRLNKLKRFRRHDDSTPVARLVVGFGARVSPNTPIVVLRNDASWRQRRAACRLVKIKDAVQRAIALHEDFDSLHDEALEAIRAGLPKAYKTITDEYIEALTSLPAAWRRYGEEYTSEAASGIELFEYMPLDWLEENMWSELREAFRTPHREVAYQAVILPYLVAMRALELDAEALFKRMMSLYISIYREAKTAPDPDVRRLVHGRCVSIPVEVATIHLAYRLSDKKTGDDERQRLRVYLEFMQLKLAELAKTAMDEDPADTKTPAEINHGWNEIFQNWHPEHEGPFDFEVDHARRTFGPSHATTLGLEARALERDQFAALKREVVVWRDALRFGLAYWAYRRLTTSNDAVWLAPMHEFQQYFGSLDHLTASIDRALQDARGEPWFSWLLRDSIGSTAGPSVDWEMLHAYFAFAPFVVQPTLPEPSIKRPAFLAHQMREARVIHRKVAANAVLWALLPPPPDAARRMAVVWRSLRRAI